MTTLQSNSTNEEHGQPIFEEVTMPSTPQTSISSSSNESSVGDGNLSMLDSENSAIDDNISLTEEPRSKTPALHPEAKPWPEDSAVFLSNQQDESEGSFCGDLSRHCCSILSSPSRFLLAQKNALLYSYMTPVLRRGASNHKHRNALFRKQKKDRLSGSNANTTSSQDSQINELSKTDLYTVPKSMEAQRLADLFWSMRRTRLAEPPSAWSFLKLLWVIAKPTYILAGYWQFITVLCQCSLPLLVRLVLLQLEEHPYEPFRKQGLSLAFAIFAISLLQGVSDERQKFLAFQTGKYSFVLA